jgi:hypothetical protein
MAKRDREHPEDALPTIRRGEGIMLFSQCCNEVARSHQPNPDSAIHTMRNPRSHVRFCSPFLCTPRQESTRQACDPFRVLFPSLM